MISSKQILGVSEEYLLTKNFNGKEFVLYLNPSRDEFKEMVRHSRNLGGDNVCRFVADGRTKKMYSCNAFQVRHADIRKLVGLPENFESTPFTIDGYVSVDSSGKAVMFAWEDFQMYIGMKNKHSKKMNEYFSKVFSYDWKWLDRYAACADYIFHLQLDFEDMLFG